jgi:hypothetical protein
MPLWWFYPAALRRWFIRRWRKKVPAWTQMVEETRVLSLRRLRSLFPESETYTEWLLMFPKSYILYARRKQVEVLEAHREPNSL